MQIFKPSMHPARSAAALSGLALVLGGCANSPVAPEELAVPARLTCFDLAAPASYQHEGGLLKFLWDTRLERGPYVSEREDAGGTYYRAPPGGVSRARPDALDKPAGLVTHMTWDGGIYIPRDPSVLPHQYVYFTTEAVGPVVPPPESNCSNVAVLRDPTTKGVSTVAYGTAGAIGGVAGGIAARTTGATGASYGKAAGTGAVGGAIGGVLVAALINMDIGKILHRAPDTDAAFVATLRAAAAKAAPLPETPASAVASAN